MAPVTEIYTGVGDVINGYRPTELPEGEDHQASCSWISADYFSVHRIAMREGRSFPPNEKDAVVVNEAVARRFWPGESTPRRTLLTQVSKRPIPITGVIADAKRKVSGEPVHDQIYFPSPENRQMNLRVRRWSICRRSRRLSAK